MTDKATMEVPAPFAGTGLAPKADPGQQLRVSPAALSYAPTGQDQPAPAPPRPAEEKPAPAAAPAAGPGSNGPSRALLPVKAAPSVRYMARKLGIDLAQVAGSGPEGRVLIQDLTDRIRRAQPPHPQPLSPQGRGGQEILPSPLGGEGSGVRGRPRPDYGKPGTKIKLQGLRRTIAERMVQSKRSIPHYTYVDECDVTELVRLREGMR